MTTTFRTDVADGLMTILGAFQAAHGDLLRTYFRARPTSMVNDQPYAYINNRKEVIRHTQGTRIRTMNPEIIVVSSLVDPTTTASEFDELVDLLVDHFTDYPHVTTGTVWDDMTVVDDLEELPDGSYRYSARFQFSDISIMEGRA